MKPFLLLSIRAETAAAENEYASFLRFSGLDEAQLPVVNLVAEELSPVDLDAWSGIVLGGGPWNASDPEATKTPAQRRSERSITALLDDVVAADFPSSAPATASAPWASTRAGSWTEATRRRSVPGGRADAGGAGGPGVRRHPHRVRGVRRPQGGARHLPATATRLATSAGCPVQAFRVGANVYATQFHPELDLHGVCTRIEVYKDAGYFDPSRAETLKERSRAVEVTHPMTVLANFVERHRR